MLFDKNNSNIDVQDITNTVFFSPKAKTSEVLLIFGAPEGDWTPAARVYNDKLVPLIIASGGMHRRTNGVPESTLIKANLIQLGIPSEVIIEDANAGNTLENVINFKNILETHYIYPKTIMYLSLNHHSGRCYLTLKKYFPDTQITSITHGYLYSGLDITSENWTNNIASKEHVYGEYERILNYSNKGDIANPFVLKNKI